MADEEKIPETIMPTTAPTSALDENNPKAYMYSVRKWKYDDAGMGARPTYAQLINDDYFDPSRFPQNCTVRWFVETYTWNYANLSNSKSELKFDSDLSDKIVSVSIDCDGSSNIKQNATVTMLVKPTNNWWYMRKQTDWHEASWHGIDSGYGGVSSSEEMNPMWIPVVYKIYQKFYYYKDDNLPDQNLPTNREINTAKNSLYCKDNAPMSGEINWFSSNTRLTPYLGHDSEWYDNDNVIPYRYTKERHFGYFLPTSTGYNYDSTTNEVTLSLQSLAYGLTKEGGNSLITPITTFAYQYDMSYNGRTTSKEAYTVDVVDLIGEYQKVNDITSSNKYVVANGKLSPVNDVSGKTTTKSTPSVDTKTYKPGIGSGWDGEANDISKEKEYVDKIEYEYLNKYNQIRELSKSAALRMKIFGTARCLYAKNTHTIPITTFEKTTQQGIKGTFSKPKTIEIQVEDIQIQTPMGLSISGNDIDGFFLLFDTNENIIPLFYNISVNRYDGVMNAYHMPLNGYNFASYDTEDTSKSQIFPNGWDFENGTSAMDLMEKVMEDKYYEGHIYIDEERKFNLTTYPTIRTYKRGFIPFRYYSELVVSEDISYDDSGYYNVTEVWGKNGEYYGVYDGSNHGNFKGSLDNSNTAIGQISHEMEYVRYSYDARIQSIVDDSLESDESCFQKAEYETWKSTRGNCSITVKLVDNYIIGTNWISHMVGDTFVEYRTMGGKTILCVLEKASLSDNMWTWSLKPFNSFASSYDWCNYTEYHKIKTKNFDEYIGASWRTEWTDNDDTNDITAYAKNRLSAPEIIAYQLLEDNTLRLYISAIDIGHSIVKIYTAGHSAFNYGIFLGEAVNCNGTDKLPYGAPCAKSVDDILSGGCTYKIFDYKLEAAGGYGFLAVLYSPLHEDSPSSHPVSISIPKLNPTKTHIVEKKEHTDEKGNITIIPEIVPQIDDSYLVNERRDILMTDNDELITINKVEYEPNKPQPIIKNELMILNYRDFDKTYILNRNDHITLECYATGENLKFKWMFKEYWTDGEWREDIPQDVQGTSTIYSDAVTKPTECIVSRIIVPFGNYNNYILYCNVTDQNGNERGLRLGIGLADDDERK